MKGCLRSSGHSSFNLKRGWISKHLKERCFPQRRKVAKKIAISFGFNLAPLRLCGRFLTETDPLIHRTKYLDTRLAAGVDSPPSTQMLAFLVLAQVRKLPFRQDAQKFSGV